MVALHLLGAGIATAWLLNSPGSLRHFVLLGCVWLYLIRQFITLFVFIKRAVGWSEVAQVGPFLFFIQVFFGFLGSRAQTPWRLIDGIALALYLIGSTLGSVSELQRNRWKAYPENKGHLYTQGLFRWSMHINYFADTLLFTGFALLTTSPWALLLPLLMTLMFVFIHIPLLDRHLAQKYGAEFDAWARTTKKFIPFLY